MEISGLLMAEVHFKDVWKCAMMEYGGRYAVVDGAWQMQMSYADN